MYRCQFLASPSVNYRNSLFSQGARFADCNTGLLQVFTWGSTVQALASGYHTGIRINITLNITKKQDPPSLDPYHNFRKSHSDIFLQCEEAWQSPTKSRGGSNGIASSVCIGFRIQDLGLG